MEALAPATLRRSANSSTRKKEPETEEVEQYRVCNQRLHLPWPSRSRRWCGFTQRAGAENLTRRPTTMPGWRPTRRFDVGHTGLQPCWLLLFQREAMREHHPGDGAAALSVRGGQDLAARRQNGHQLQRSVPGAGPVRAADAAAAGDGAAGIELRAGGGGCAALRGAAHRILCTGRKLLGTCRLRARFCPPGIGRRLKPGRKQQKRRLAKSLS